LLDYNLGKSLSQPVVSTSSMSKLTGINSGGSSSSSSHHHSDIERIMAKIEQDNRVLAELDKSRATISKFRPTHIYHHLIINVNNTQKDIFIAGQDLFCLFCYFSLSLSKLLTSSSSSSFCTPVVSFPPPPPYFSDYFNFNISGSCAAGRFLLSTLPPEEEEEENLFFSVCRTNPLNCRGPCVAPPIRR
jgi:hypothetical protein